MESETHSDYTYVQHSLSEAHFDELSFGHGSADVLHELWRGEISRRHILMRAFYDLSDREAALMGPLPSVDHAWQALEQAQESNPHAIRALIAHPQVGNWLAYSLRRTRGGAHSDAPLYVDFGQINALALAAAAMAGQPLITRVPLRHGRVMIPCFGMASFAGCAEWEVAEAGVTDGQIWLRHGDRLIKVPEAQGTDAEGWRGLRRITVGDDPVLTVWLDDLDPMRDLADPIPPARITDADVGRWAGLLDDAWKILCNTQPELAGALAVGVTSLAPLPMDEGWETRSASSGDAFGAVLCSPPEDAVTLAVSLVHEFMHIKLGGLMHLLPMIERDSSPILYAPWRDDPRPLGGLLQGVYAFVGIAGFWRQYRQGITGIDRKVADFEYCYARMQANEGLANARSAEGLTVRGMTFLEQLATEIHTWSDTIPEEIISLARLVALGHRMSWRIRHCQPAEEDIKKLAAAWGKRQTATIRIGPSSVLPDPEMRHWSQGRLGLARRRFFPSAQYLEALREKWGAALTQADLALFSGDAATAGKIFAEQITDDPERADAWSGLGLVLDTDGHAGHRAMTVRPEVVQRVYRHVAIDTDRPSPLEVAAWVDAVIAP